MEAGFCTPERQMKNDHTNLNFEAELDSYTGSRGPRSADWGAHLRRWPLYAAATSAALAMATSADAGGIVSGYSGQKIGIELGQVADRTGARSFVNFPGLGRVGLELSYSHQTNGLIFSQTAQARLFGSNGTAVIDSDGFLARFNAGQLITQGMSHSGGGILHLQPFRYLIGFGVLNDTGGGLWPSGKTGYAGFKLANGDLGWIQLDWTSGGGGIPTGLKAMNWAVETTPGMSIAAGETESSAGSAPEPGTFALGLLAMGASGIAAWRKSRRARA